ncbi:hypothetical protein BH24ACI3_BH24ACI3_14370 [soil metagenome]
MPWRLCDENVAIDTDGLLAAVEVICGVPRSELVGGGKSARLVRAKEVFFVDTGLTRNEGPTLNER